MPSKSAAQAKLMAAVAHNPKFAKKVGIPVSVGKEFNHADMGLDSVKRYADGGKVVAKPKPMTGSDMDSGKVPTPGTGAIRNERTGKVMPVGNDAPMGGAKDKDREAAMPKFAAGGKVNIHGMAIHQPMSMHKSKMMRG